MWCSGGIIPGKNRTAHNEPLTLRPPRIFSFGESRTARFGAEFTCFQNRTARSKFLSSRILVQQCGAVRFFVTEGKIIHCGAVRYGSKASHRTTSHRNEKRKRNVTRPRIFKNVSFFLALPCMTMTSHNVDRLKMLSYGGSSRSRLIDRSSNPTWCI